MRGVCSVGSNQFLVTQLQPLNRGIFCINFSNIESMNTEQIEKSLMIASAIAAIVSAVVTSQQAFKQSNTQTPSVLAASIEPCTDGN